MSLQRNLKSFRHSQFLLAVRMVWRYRESRSPCRKTYNLTLRTIQVHPRARVRNFLTFAGPLKQREQDIDRPDIASPSVIRITGFEATLQQEQIKKTVKVPR